MADPHTRQVDLASSCGTRPINRIFQALSEAGGPKVFVTFKTCGQNRKSQEIPLLRQQWLQAQIPWSTEASLQRLKLQSPGVGKEYAPCQTGEGIQGRRDLEGVG